MMKDLTQEQSKLLFARIARGEMSDAELSKLLLDLREKGESAAEIAGAASAFLEVAVPFASPDYHVADCVGTGGDGKGTLNVSTPASFVAAEMGLRVAKHGSIAVSSKCGSADVLRGAGINIEMSAQTARRCLDEVGVTFLFAPKYHHGFRHAAAVRKALGVRTIFNILGPLINPARPQIQLAGVYSAELVPVYADTLLRLGLQQGLVVHGSGLDEIALHGPTEACLIRNGEVKKLQITPHEVGLTTFALEDVAGGDAHTNLNAMVALLSGQGSDAYNAMVAINAGALFWISEGSASLRDSVQHALSTIKSGKCIDRLTKLVKMSQYD